MENLRRPPVPSGSIQTRNRHALTAERTTPSAPTGSSRLLRLAVHFSLIKGYPAFETGWDTFCCAREKNEGPGYENRGGPKAAGFHEGQYVCSVWQGTCVRAPRRSRRSGLGEPKGRTHYRSIETVDCWTTESAADCVVRQSMSLYQHTECVSRCFASTFSSQTHKHRHAHTSTVAL